MQRGMLIVYHADNLGDHLKLLRSLKSKADISGDIWPSCVGQLRMFVSPTNQLYAFHHCWDAKMVDPKLQIFADPQV